MRARMKKTRLVEEKFSNVVKNSVDLFNKHEKKGSCDERLGIIDLYFEKRKYKSIIAIITVLTMLVLKWEYCFFDQT